MPSGCVARVTETVIGEGETFVELHIKWQHTYNLDSARILEEHTQKSLEIQKDFFLSFLYLAHSYPNHQHGVLSGRAPGHEVKPKVHLFHRF